MDKQLIPVNVVEPSDRAKSSHLQMEIITPSGFMVRFDASVDPNWMAKLMVTLEHRVPERSC